MIKFDPDFEKDRPWLEIYVRRSSFSEKFQLVISEHYSKKTRIRSAGTVLPGAYASCKLAEKARSRLMCTLGPAFATAHNLGDDGELGDEQLWEEQADQQRSEDRWLAEEALRKKKENERDGVPQDLAITVTEDGRRMPSYRSARWETE